MQTDDICASFSALIGIDWADQKHDICLYDTATGNTTYEVIKHSAEHIREWALTLKARYNGGSICIATELKSGPLIHALLQHSFISLVPIAPNALAKYRKAFSQSGAKDDPSDAFLLVDFLYHHHDKLSIIEPDTLETRYLQKLVEHRRQLVQEKVRVTNRIRHALKEYYPQILDWFLELDTPVFCDFFEKWPSLTDIKKSHSKTIKQFFLNHNSRSDAAIEKRLMSIKQAVPLTSDDTTIGVNIFYVKTQISLLRSLLINIKKYDAEIASSFRSHHDFFIFDSLPGAGPVFGPRLLAAMGSNRKRFDGHESLVKQIGVAPVLERSGKKEWVHWRRACPKFVRQTFVEWAYLSIRYSYWAKIFYDKQREKGKTHQATLRSLAFKWARILYRCWLDKTPYNEANYLLALKRKNSSLVSSNG